MDKQPRKPNYIIIIAILAASTIVTYWAYSRPTVEVVGATVNDIPEEIGGWHEYETDYVTGQDVLDAWNANEDTFLNRWYINDNGEFINLIVVFKGTDRRGWHLSEMCYSGGGYTVEQSTTEIPYAGKEATAVRLYAEEHHSGNRDLVLYWFASGTHTEHDFFRQQTTMMLGKINPRRYGWAFIRVSSPVVTTQEHTMDILREFMQEAQGPILSALTSGELPE